MIDNGLTWTKQQKKVMKSFSAKVNELKRFRDLPRRLQEQMYYKTVITAVTYRIAVWGTASDSPMDELDTLHAKAAKIICNILRRTVQMKRYYKKLTGNQLVTCINKDC